MGNITENKLNTVITTSDLSAINDAISSISSKLPAGSLTDDQRATLKSINVSNKIFVEDVITETTVNGSEIIPSFVQTANIQTDITLFDQLDTIESGINTLLQKISDLKRIAGDEAYTGALVCYRLFEGANTAGINSAKQSYEKLRARFDAQGNTGRPLDQI
ncbi:hypothetical protein NZ698_16895 [Chryseobacterium sp. PBS4-4]|uniref:Uncharacterized protein n=1 Tax=Chryseobacterium edaphi TaxID=2976532 RepID=A0ABT2WE18_9FLAO|nr:hypothetical protein [Chryseobacterium edaphi]MCU7618860.1 hypothetical protein [Chryseobacterium edaphi]